MASDKAYSEAKKRIALASELGLVNLDLRNLGLAELPESIGELEQLKSLKLGYNHMQGGRMNCLHALPQSIENLIHLQQLDLCFNQLVSVPEWFKGFSRLRVLDLSFNQLIQLPDWLGRFSQLQEIRFGNNHLKGVPQALGNLAQLRVLCLANNQLKDLPQSIGYLNQLRDLNLDNNPLNAELSFAYEQGVVAVQDYLRDQVLAQAG